MTRRNDAAVTLFLIMAALTLPTTGRADPVELFFAAGPYPGGEQVMQTEWRLRGDTTGQLSLEVYQRDLDRGGRFETAEWRLREADLVGSLELPKKNGQPIWRVAGLMTAQPAITALDFKGVPRSDCMPSYHPVPPAAARFAEVFALLNTPLPAAEQAMAVAPALESLPPAAMLPELEQIKTEQLLSEKADAFWQRYSKISLKRAADLTDAAVFTELHAVLVKTAETNRGNSAWHADLLASAVAVRSAARIAAGQSAQIDATSDAQFCARIGVMHTQLMPWEPYLEAATGVAFTGWDEALVQNYLTLAATCPGGKAFGDVITQYWPQIQLRAQGRADLAAEAARLEGLELTLANAQAEDWFQISRFRAQGLTETEISDQLAPILAALATKAVTPLAAELAKGVETAPFDTIAGYCQARWQRLATGNRVPPVLAEAQKACEVEAAAVYKAAGITLIETQKTELLALEPTLNALRIGTTFTIPELRQRFGPDQPGFAIAQDDLNTAIAAANAALAPKVQLARDAVAMRIKQVVAEAGPLDHENNVSEACYQVQKLRISGVEELTAFCMAELAKVKQAQEVALCDAIWTVTPGPKGFRQGTLAIPSQANPVPVEKLFCSRGFIESGVTIADNSGIFSSEFLLTNTKIVGGTPIRFTAILTEPAMAGAPWALTEPKLNDTPLSNPAMKTSADFLRCALQLEACFRAN